MMSALARNTFQSKCETPGAVLTRVVPFRQLEKNETSSRKAILTNNSLSDTKKARKAASNYDQSLIMLSNSLEQICRKSNGENNVNGKDNCFIIPSPLVSHSPPARPLSNNFKPSSKTTTYPSKNTPIPKNISKQNSTENIQIRVKHEETGDKLKEDLNKIISSSPVANYTEESPMVLIRKKLTDAQEFLRTKFRLKINTSKYPSDNSKNFYVVVNKTRLIKVNRVSSSSSSENTSQCANKQPQQDSNTTPSLDILHHSDFSDESDGPVNISTVLHSSTIPNSVRLERLLGSFIEGPCIYIRPSSMATSEYHNTSLMSIPILHLDESSMRFSLSLKVPSEITAENIEVKRVDDIVTIKGWGYHFLSSDLNSQDSVLESAFKVNVELPEDSDGRSLVAHITSRRMLIVEGDLLLNSRRMTCQF